MQESMKKYVEDRKLLEAFKEEFYARTVDFARAMQRRTEQNGLDRRLVRGDFEQWERQAAMSPTSVHILDIVKRFSCRKEVWRRFWLVADPGQTPLAVQLLSILEAEIDAFLEKHEVVDAEALKK